MFKGEYINRSNWTIHVGLVMRECAKLMGARTFFEQGGRTDAVLQYPDNQILTYVEWEYNQADRDSVNELDKLLEKTTSAISPHSSHIVSMKTSILLLKKQVEYGVKQAGL